MMFTIALAILLLLKLCQLSEVPLSFLKHELEIAASPSKQTNKRNAFPQRYLQQNHTSTFPFVTDGKDLKNTFK